MFPGIPETTFGAIRRTLPKIAIILGAAAISVSAYAQVDSGAIVGVVRDSSGALVANGSVTLTSQDTGATNTTSTNHEGEYTFSPVKIGVYTVVVDAPGLSRFEHKNI